MGKVKEFIDTIGDLVLNEPSKPGYDAGEKRGREGKNKNPYRTWTETDRKTKLKFFLQGSSAIASWNQQYNRGYNTALQLQTLKYVLNDNNTTNNYSTNNKTNTSMARRGASGSSVRNIEFQLELAEDLKKYLQGFQGRLDGAIKNYENRYNNFGNVMLANFHSKFGENLEETRRAINDLIERINEEDIPTIDEYISNLQPLLY